MSEADHSTPADDDDASAPSPRVAADAIRDAIAALESERPDLAARLRELVVVLEEDDPHAC